MTKKEIVILFSPGVFFLLIAITALLSANIIRQSTIDAGSQQKFESFVENVKSGKWQLTTEKWLEGMRDEHNLANGYRSAGAGVVKMFLLLMFASLVGFFVYLAVICSFVRKVNMKSSTR